MSRCQLSGFSTNKETEKASHTQVRWTQPVFFPYDIKQLLKGQHCSVRLCKLAPFLDKYNLLKVVRGRLAHTKIPYKERYHLLLPKLSRPTTFPIDYVY